MSIENPTLAHFRHFRHFIPLYICRETSTNQLLLCKTNPILSAVGGLQMNVSNIITRNYKDFIPLAGQKNKPKTNPIKPNLRKAKMNINSTLTKDYRKKEDFEVRINKPNLVRRRRIAKMNANAFSQKDYGNETTLRPQKNKPKTNPILERMKEIL